MPIDQFKESVNERLFLMHEIISLPQSLMTCKQGCNFSRESRVDGVIKNLSMRVNAPDIRVFSGVIRSLGDP